MQTFDVIVLGVGGVGSAALDQLAQRGVRAVGIDRFAPGHDRGSSHGQSRIIRQAYFEHPDYVPLLLEAWRLWRELEARRGEKLLFEVGLIQVGPPQGQVVPGVLEAARLHGLPVETLTGREVESRFPGFRAPEPLVGVFEQRAGYLLVEQAVQALATEAQRQRPAGQGAQLHVGQAVRSWRPDGAGVMVETDRERYSAGRLIVAAGAWSGTLLDGLACDAGKGEEANSRAANPHPTLSLKGEGSGGVTRFRSRLRVVRKQVQWYPAPEGAYAAAAGTPTFLYELPEGVFYGFPQLDASGVKVAEHSGGQPVADPLELDRSLNQADAARVAAFCRAHMPRLGSELLSHSVCMYTLSPDEHFIVDRHPKHPQVAFAAGLSGHGFKFVPVLGRILAGLALDGRTELPIEFLSCRRPGLQAR